MSLYKILVLTDHTTHGLGESIYSLIQDMANHQLCDHIFIASRGHPQNYDFFKNPSSQQLFGKVVDQFYNYENASWWYTDGSISINPYNYKVIFLRLDRPVNSEYLIKLNQCFSEKKLIINNPIGIQKTSSKEFLLKFPELCPEMYLCNNIEEVKLMANKFPIVMKPFLGYGGKGLIKVDTNKKEIYLENQKFNLDRGFEIVKKILDQNKVMLTMRFLPKVIEGDKRIVVVNGQILGAILRLPSQNSWLCNVSQGGISHSAIPNDDEIKIVNTINPELLKEGIVIYGIDTLIDGERRVLTEINTLNVGGLIQIEQHSHKPVIHQASNLLWDYIQQQYDNLA